MHWGGEDYFFSTKHLGQVPLLGILLCSTSEEREGEKVFQAFCGTTAITFPSAHCSKIGQGGGGGGEEKNNPSHPM